MASSERSLAVKPAGAHMFALRKKSDVDDLLQILPLTSHFFLQTAEKAHVHVHVQ